MLDRRTAKNLHKSGLAAAAASGLAAAAASGLVSPKVYGVSHLTLVNILHRS